MCRKVSTPFARLRASLLSLVIFRVGTCHEISRLLRLRNADDVIRSHRKQGPGDGKKNSQPASIFIGATRRRQEEPSIPVVRVFLF